MSRRHLASVAASSLAVASCAHHRPDRADHPHHDSPAAHAHGTDHGAHHRFEDVEKWAERFENPERDAWQKPDVVIGALGLTPAMTVADIGAATGYFPVRLARELPEGRVIGVDIEPKMVRYLEARAQREGLDNLQAIEGTPADPKLPPGVDRVLVVNTYHHISDRVAYFGRLRSKLNPGARVMVVDFKQGDLPVGPPAQMKIPRSQVTEELDAAGYTSRVIDADLPYQYIVVGELP